LPNKFSLKDASSNPYFYPGKQYVLQILSIPEPLKELDEFVLIVQRWNPSSYTFGLPEEIFVKETLKIEEFVEKLSEKFGIKDLSFSKVSFDLEPLETPDNKWFKTTPVHTNSNYLLKNNISNNPLFLHDSDHILYKDNTESLKVLSSEEKENFEKESKARKALRSDTMFRGKEKALKIKVDN